MKRFYIRSRFIMSVLGVGALVASCLWLNHQLFTINRYIFSFDQTISDKTQQKIAAYVEANQLSIFNGPAIADAIQERFSFVHNVTLSYLPIGVVCVEIIADQPEYWINNTQVITRKGSLYAKKVFTKHNLALLPSIAISFDEDQQALPTRLHDVVTNLPSHVFTTYDFEWDTEHIIWLRDKEKPQFAIVFAADQLPTEKVLFGCTQIKQVLHQRLALECKTHWVADIRFNDQIIVYKGLGG